MAVAGGMQRIWLARLGTGTVRTLWPVPPRTRLPAGRVRHPEGVSNRISI